LSLVSVPFVALALSRVRQADSGVASSVVNVAPLVGGSVGIAALGTVAWTIAAHEIHLTRSPPVSEQNSTQIGSSRHDGMGDTSMIGTSDKPHDHQARVCVM
jgi:hypothetical protein